MPAWKKLLLEGDSIPAESVSGGEFPGSYSIDGTLAVDTISENTEDGGVTIDGLLIKDGVMFAESLPFPDIPPVSPGMHF
jgi:hypothetical protein